MAERKRPRKSPQPKKHGTVIKKKKKVASAQQGPVWTRAEGPIHPALEAQLAKPFLATIFIDKETSCFRFPVEGRDTPHTLGGLHVRMRQKFFKGKELPRRIMKKGKEARRLPSSKVDGSRADRALEKAIKTGVAPPATSKYAAGVWKWWADNGHRPVLAQLPVILVKQNIATAGDYFTVHTDEVTGEQRLHLWELKTGWPYVYKKKNLAEADTMSAPLDHIWMTPWNRWQLQVLITRMAYERELGLVIDGGAHVIHAWLERPFGLSGYECKVNVVQPADLEPPNWTVDVNKETLYQAI